jgi:hypothetical protein
VLTSWDGELEVEGGELVQTPYWSPEVVAAERSRLAWRNSTRSFGEPYGAQRGGVECTLAGPPDASVRLRAGDRTGRFRLADLAGLAAPLELPGAVGSFRVQPGTGGLSSLGSTSVDLRWTDEFADAAFYYVRVFQTDGEMAWSSPIWVTPHKGDAP